MKMPKAVTILGRKFKVVVVSPEKMKAMTGLDLSGAMNFTKRLILIEDSHSKEDMIVTLHHEVAHVVQFITGLAQVTDPNMAEIWCESMANGFLDLHKAIR